MPIIGLTDEQSFDLNRAMPRIGKLRKGDEKKSNRPGEDLDYFRVTFEEEFEYLREEFKAMYGDKPVEFGEVQFIAANVEAAFETWYEDYDSKQTLLHRCDGETQHITYNPTSGKHHTWIEGKTAKIDCRASGGEGCGTCKQVGRLRVVLMDFAYKTGTYGYFVIETHSIHDILNLYNGLRLMQDRFDKGLLGVPFVLGRSERVISTPMGKDKTGNVKRGKTAKSLLYIRPSSQFVKAVMLQAPEPTPLLPASVDSREALGNGDTRRVAALPGPEVVIVEDDVIVENGAEADSDPSPPPEDEPASAEQTGDSEPVPTSAVRANEVYEEYLASMFANRVGYNGYLIDYGPDSEKPVFTWEHSATVIASLIFMHRCQLIFGYTLPTVCDILDTASFKAYIEADGNSFASAWDAVQAYRIISDPSPIPEMSDTPELLAEVHGISLADARKIIQKQQQVEKAEKESAPDLPPPPPADAPPSDFKGAGGRKIKTAWNGLSAGQRHHTGGESDFKDKAKALLKENAALSADKLREAVMAAIEAEAEALKPTG